ncbi:hypothetical protein K7X08_023617 [Anisodus acutangulus]|uniref:Cyclin-dependent kinase inhibitor n=1 Tax=Anisodus acutangulus TaxID=402998 RepID=A0A9Q1LAE8_9SOLA|nr:hypothetical protein K7X08_023617 [Anisodus acutangulus]
MGKYMRKSKEAGEVSPHGVLTRAKTLALQKSRMVVSPATGNGGDGGSYLELRSRRLIKPFTVLEGKRQKHKDPNLLNPNPRSQEEGKDCLGAEEMENENSCFGENFLEFEGSKRTTRESTPCSLIGDSETPGSSTRRINPNGRVPDSMRANIPTAQEMDEFFTRAEEQQLRKFIEKYNFDPVNEKPLPGRYEWVKVDC